MIREAAKKKVPPLRHKHNFFNCPTSKRRWDKKRLVKKIMLMICLDHKKNEKVEPGTQG